jgi:hypothetical protein
MNIPKYMKSVSIVSNKTIDIYQGNHGKFYNIKNTDVYYDIHFPLLWAVDNISCETNIGPLYCENCIYNGYYNGVFIGYCVDCAYHYEFKRGYGLFAHGIEVNEHLFNSLYNDKSYFIENTIWNTYLKNVLFDDIGDDYLEKNIILKIDEYKDISNAVEKGFVTIRKKNVQ